MLPVNEIFTTIQGEASFTGTPATFVRLQGCPVGCAWCDTKHTWYLNADKVSTLHELDAKTADSERYAWVECADIVQRARTDHVVLTGGEPCLYDLVELTSQLIQAGHSVQIETSGTQPVRAHEDTFVTVSPKVRMPGGFHLDDSALKRADEIKMPVGRMRDIYELQELIDTGRVLSATPVYLQPLSLSAKATALCVEQAIARNWHVSIQTHKMIGVR